MPTIAVFGASGRTGLPLVRQALERGYQVRVLVRDPQKMDFEDARLEVHPGNVLDPAKVLQTLRGADGVISLLGQDKSSPPDLQTRATQYIIDGMKQLGIRRLISLTGAGVRDADHDRPGLIDQVIVFVMRNLAGKGPRNALQDGINHANLIRQSGLDWTIVRGPVLTEDPPAGAFQVGYVGTVKGIKLTREDLATFILDEFEQGRHIQQMPFVTNG